MLATAHALALSRLFQHTAVAVRAVREGASLNDALLHVPDAARAGTQALSFQTLRRLGLALALQKSLVTRPPRADIEALLLTALALLSLEAEEARYTEHTLVDQAVKAARQIQAASAGFVNAVLRRFQRERVALLAAAQRSVEARYNHPRWWIERLQRDWPDDWQALLHQAHLLPPMTLRVNLQRTGMAAYLEALGAAGLRAHALDAAVAGDAAVILERPCGVNALPGFFDGDVSVQDAAAQRAAPMLLQGLPRGQGLRVLDACAAPGGKTAHLLEIDPTLHVLALDHDPERLKRVQQNLERLRLPGPGHATVQLKAADARQLASWWDGKPFDAILLDAPCTASGIVRRHPDIVWLRRSQDVKALARTQAELLDALWATLVPGGVMVYASCSIFKEEGVQQIDAFLQRGLPSPPKLDPASAGHLLPLPDNSASTAAHDGFFYARFLKPT